MQSLAIIGAQWGDEGKGKITDLLSSKCDLVVRYQGGNNAGHTIIIGKKKIVLHLIPSGILHDHCTSIIAHGVAFDPEAFFKELQSVKDAGYTVNPEKLKISENCSIITYYNKLLDIEREEKDLLKIGTTGKGIGPTYEDKISRKGIKLRDLFDIEILRKKLNHNLKEKISLFENLYCCEYPNIEEEATRLFELGKKIVPYTANTFNLINSSSNKKVLFEGAQGVLLDIDYGSYPFVTSSNTSYGGIFTGASVPGGVIDEVLGIAKAYTTRVGEGPFPTEFFDKIGESIQEKGKEFGATTGRKRRCGWLDLPLLKYAVKSSNLTSIALTKLDVLSGMGTLKVCTHYKYKGKIIDSSHPSVDLAKVAPIFKELTPFKDDFSGELSKELQDFISLIEQSISIPIGILAYGPERNEIKFLKKYF